MDFFFLILPGILSFIIIHEDVSIQKKPAFHEMLKLLKNLILLIYFNVIVSVSIYKIAFSLPAPIIEGRLHPSIVSVKGLLIFSIVSILIGKGWQTLKKKVQVGITIEKIS
ncbi:hypothetical protein [Proteiniclasticum ruminis]|uniref:hypothetical protein n=1 Tax=Proteiniclasticum ruminis TaxID=398199 RepID=UPI0028A75F65|nr:hypothetical protein [Proteiniclasticum ruminis]